MSDHPAPNPAALARHLQPCQRRGPSLAELQAHAGNWDRYPKPEMSAPRCPSCGHALPPLMTYCDRVCYLAGQKRAYKDAAKRREADALPGYSFPLPMKGSS